jgi:hypothetical protein
MSLDVLRSKQIDIKCKTLEANESIILNLGVDTLYLPTISDETIIEHDIIGTVGAETRIKRLIKQHVVNDFYVQNSVVFIFRNYGPQAVEEYYIATVSTTGTPGVSPDWGILGSLFNKNAGYSIGDAKIMHGGFEYQCLVATTPGALFNPAEWSKIGLAHNEIGESIILESMSNATDTTITLGRNSKDVAGMLKLFSPSINFESELIAPTGNIIFEPPTPFRDTTPHNFADRAVINYDSSQNFVFTRSRADSLDISGRIMFITHDRSLDAPFEMCSIKERNITGVAAPFGELHTDIVSSCGFTFRDFSNNSPTHGTATLTTGAVDVTTEACGFNSIILIQPTVLTTPHGDLRVSTKGQGKFTVLSTNGSDGSTFDWVLFNPDFTP